MLFSPVNQLLSVIQTMAGIVASTLRRKAFHRGARTSDQAKFVTTTATVGPSQSNDGGGTSGGSTAGHAASYSPTPSRLSSRSSSFVYRSTELDDQQHKACSHGNQVTTSLPLIQCCVWLVLQVAGSNPDRGIRWVPSICIFTTSHPFSADTSSASYIC